MDFIIGLPKFFRQHDSIMVVVDKLSKEAHFVPLKYTYKAVNIANIFMKEFFRLHGILKVIIWDRDVKFTRHFWKSLFKGLGTQLNFGTAYHMQMGEHTERVNQVLEYMLRMYVMEKPGKWEDYLHLVEFSYNNNFQVSAGMSYFEILYGCKCNTPIFWSSPVDRLMSWPNFLKDMELIMKQLQENLKATQAR